GRPQEVRAVAGQLSGNPLALARVRSDPAVKRGRGLPGDERPGFALEHEKACVDLCGLFLEETHGHLNARVLEPFDAGTRNARVGVPDRHEDAVDSRLDQGIGAGWGDAMMAARLEGHVSHRTARRLARPPQRLGFSVRAPARLGPATSHDAALPYDDATNRR